MSRPEPNRHARRAARASQSRKGTALATSAAAGLLAATGAQATTYDESIDGELPESFESRVLMTVGTTAVSGEVSSSQDQDHFAFQSLAPNASFDITLDPPIGPSVYYWRLSDTGSVVAQDCIWEPSSSFTGTVPASGLVNLEASSCEGTATWGVSLDLVAAGPTYDEDSSGDLGDSFAQRTQLGRGADHAIGAIDPDLDADHLTFQGLAPGGALSLTLDVPVGNGGVSYAWLDDEGQTLDSMAVYNNSAQPSPFEGTVPSNGEVHLRITNEEGGTKTWGVTVDVPEPGPASLWSTALATLAGLVRRRAPKS